MVTIQLQLKDYICTAPPGDMFYGKRKARTFYLLPLTEHFYTERISGASNEILEGTKTC